jgi:putative FmdB family regulatory protein
MIYTYYCETCKGTVDREFPMGQQPSVVECSNCQGEARRLYQPPAIHYKGTGWTGAGHGIPDLDEREKLPGPLEFDDLLEE